MFEIELSGERKLIGNFNLQININLKEFFLSPNFPNPFNSSTTIEYIIPKNCHSTFRIYNIEGQLIKTIFDRYHLAGKHKLILDCSDLTTAMYLYRLTANSEYLTNKFLIIK